MPRALSIIGMISIEKQVQGCLAHEKRLPLVLYSGPMPRVLRWS